MTRRIPSLGTPSWTYSVSSISESTGTPATPPTGNETTKNQCLNGNQDAILKDIRGAALSVVEIIDNRRSIELDSRSIEVLEHLFKSISVIIAEHRQPLDNELNTRKLNDDISRKSTLQLRKDDQHYACQILNDENRKEQEGSSSVKLLEPIQQHEKLEPESGVNVTIDKHDNSFKMNRITLPAATLEMEYKKNSTPGAMDIERITHNIGLSEQSTRMWFQNRKEKHIPLAQKSILDRANCDQTLDIAGPYNEAKAIGPLGGPRSGKSVITPYGHPPTLIPSRVKIQHLSCRSVSIGSWRRVGQNTLDLIVFYSPEVSCMTYFIYADSRGYKIEYRFSYMDDIQLDRDNGALIVKLNHPPNFYIEGSEFNTFFQCGDFTEGRQASQVLTHYLEGHPGVLPSQLAMLVSLQNYQKRFERATII
ncbi:hypothetical protein F5884DRAFT_850607 [Xylogone sp. PMI_703]|nr:hypothetical protein F5884DRAFT_850607 [Xylogone sp. PMI_703]